MDLYNIWFDLKPGIRDGAFSDDLQHFLKAMQTDGRISGFRVMRRKLGLGPKDVGEFHVLIEVENLAQLDRAFEAAAERAEPMESFHHAVNSKVQNLQFALYRDFPDPHRKRGEEKF